MIVPRTVACDDLQYTTSIIIYLSSRHSASTAAPHSSVASNATEPVLSSLLVLFKRPDGVFSSLSATAAATRVNLLQVIVHHVLSSDAANPFLLTAQQTNTQYVCLLYISIESSIQCLTVDIGIQSGSSQSMAIQCEAAAVPPKLWKE